MSNEIQQRRFKGRRTQVRLPEDLERKSLDVNDVSYVIEMKEKGEARFMRIIENPDVQLPTRVVIPMCVADKVLQKIRDAIKFCSTYTSKNVSQKEAPNGRPESPHCLTYTSPGGRRYYFDVIDANDTVSLRISYVFGSFRDTIQMLAQALPSLLSILEEYAASYPSKSLTEDYPISGKKEMGNRPYFNNNRRFNNNDRRPRNFRDTRPHFNNGTTGSSSEGVESRRANALRVVTDPAPETIKSNAKGFKVEIVEGVNSFFRITEMINDKRKSTLHVPVEICALLHEKLSMMNKKYSKQTAAAPGSPQPPAKV